MGWKQNGPQRGKAWWVLLLGLTAAGPALAQGTFQGAAPPQIEVVRLKWEREVRLPRDFDPSVIPTGDTFSDPASRSSVPNGTSTDSTRRPPATRTANSKTNITFPATPGRLPVVYVYSLKLRNEGQVILGIAWDYLFIDPSSKTELGRHQFLSYPKAVRNKSVVLQAQLRTPPVRVVRASGQKTRGRLIEKAVVECVLYGDDTVWRNPLARPGACELLRMERSLIKRNHGPTQP